MKTRTKLLVLCSLLPFPCASYHAISLFPGISAAFNQTTFTTENTRQSQELKGYNAGGFLLAGFAFGNQRLHIGPIGDFNQSFDGKVQGYRFGGELRFDILQGWSVSPFSRLQYGFDRWTMRNLGGVDFSATGRTFKLMAGVGFPVRQRLIIALEAGFQYGVLDSGEGTSSFNAGSLQRLENRDVFSLLLGVHAGYRIFD